MATLIYSKEVGSITLSKVLQMVFYALWTEK